MKEQIGKVIGLITVIMAISYYYYKESYGRDSRKNNNMLELTKENLIRAMGAFSLSLMTINSTTGVTDTTLNALSFKGLDKDGKEILGKFDCDSAGFLFSIFTKTLQYKETAENIEKSPIFKTSIPSEQGEQIYPGLIAKR
jgi:hypothetical protein